MASNLSRFQRWAKRLVGTATGSNRTEITVETEHFVVIRRGLSYRARCPVCDKQVEMVGVDEAVAIAGRTLSETAATDRQWHCFESSDGSPRVCLDSVLHSM